MSMNSSQFPFVWISLDHKPGQDSQKDFDEFEANLQRGEPFVLLSNSAPTGDHEHSKEEKKRTSLWMKKNKAELRKLVIAMILIEPNAAKRLGFKAFAEVFSKFWGYPLILASSQDAAMEIAKGLLQTHNETSNLC
ncbi:hypothetical protein B6N13_09595 [Marinomonas sp. UCMA 3892]|uniref:Uncharacterized protein n=1 Tax=Marinomonas sp. (strain MWYL1) TaxID=400668 RepID=A6W1Y7_MARMS|nr:hypothetical protein [Marinomonas sp. UCMA 3892]NLU98357.1 hypothetical protein [Marinomonas sp. UCMA 3892]